MTEIEKYKIPESCPVCGQLMPEGFWHSTLADDVEKPLEDLEISVQQEKTEA